MDEGFARQRVLELCPQLADVDVDGALLLAERAPPDDGVELFPADDPPAPAGERSEQTQLPHGESDRAPVRERDVFRGPNLQLALPQDFVRRRFQCMDELRRKGRKVRYENVTSL